MQKYVLDSKRPQAINQICAFKKVDGGFRGCVSGDDGDIQCADISESEEAAMQNARNLLAVLEKIEQEADIASLSLNGREVLQYLNYDLGHELVCTYRILRNNDVIVDWCRRSHPPLLGDAEPHTVLADIARRHSA
ncbi:hypothetical protein GTP58_08270 [Duganella sp. CY15W]|uniref:hypothetical protein n=1 Tax=Duganella sp. CY15W TaxID=2692172 RepID=UPI001368B354|nr:hypothetical protein [Duganella sp. CY15W]MYM28317.1 hypothetical protein [Duganella sp. CY15W]